MNQTVKDVERVIGFDAHPDSFTAAILRGPTPAAAVTEKMFDKVPMAHLTNWAKKYTNERDVIALEASGNSFHIARLLARIDRRALVLESCQMGKLKEAHANNDKISAVRIAKAYLAGTAKEVWVPDLKNQARRDCLHAHRKTVKRTSQLQSRFLSYLSDNGVRPTKGAGLFEDPQATEKLRQAHAWQPRQWLVIEGLQMELRHAKEQRAHWESLIAQEVLDDPMLLSLVRLCGVRDIVAFSLGAIIGDIKRFEHPKKLVKYIGFNPAFDDSGNEKWSGGIGGHGRKDLRALLVESAQSIMRSADHPLAKWGRKLLASKGSMNLAVAAVARKLTVAIWYLMNGKWTPLEEIDKRLQIKVSKIISRVGEAGLKKMSTDRKTLRKQVYEHLKAGKVYQLDPDKKFTPSPTPQTCPQSPKQAAANPKPKDKPKSK